MSGEPIFAWRGVVADAELVALTRSHGGRPEPGWWDKVASHSLGWVTTRTGDGTLVGFVNVAWDGGDHAFLLDTKCHPDWHHQGIGTEVVRVAAQHAHSAGCEWLHVDFTADLAPFYLEACGFTSTAAGLIHLRDAPTPPRP